MKRTLSLFASIALVAAAVMTTSWRAVTDVASMAVEAFRRAKFAICDFAAAAVKTVAEKFAAISLIRVPLLQARAFVTRLAKRERPVLTASWRMCPST